MVMEAPHSAQLVGREFVRQYYTLLNRAPQFLHRFYSMNSSFIHGGLSNKDRDIIPAIGQKEIHQKIQQLKFCDCHTRINQVDSQTTLDDGVVVQVTGEFSNAGNPMRRFTQTFVLAAQAPKTYYVHNDIFRYQDGFPHDVGDDIEGDANVNEMNECEVDEGRSETEDDDQVVHQTQNVPDQGHPGHITAQQPPIHANQQQMYYAPPSQQVPIPLVINGSVHDEPLINQQLPQQPQVQQQQQYIEPVVQEQFSQEQDAAIVEQPTQPQSTQSSQPQQVPAATPITDDDSNVPSEESHEQQQQTPTESYQQQQQQPSIDNESDTHNQTANINSNRPKSYARTLRTNIMGGSSQVPKSSMSPPPMSNNRNDDRPMDIWNTGSANLTSNVMSSSQQHRMSSNQTSQQQQHQQGQQQQQQSQQQQRDHQHEQQQPQHQQQRPPRIGPTQKDNRRRDWPDSHQLFVGNVSHHAVESEIRGIFEKFGRVVEFKIFAKGNERGKGLQGQNNSMRVPQYGFITFEDASAVAKVLTAHATKPICYPEKTGQKLNIEEKKNKPRTMGDNNMRSNQNECNMRSSMGGQQQQQQPQRGPGGLGVMRGGQHPRGGRGFSRGDGGRGGMRQPGGNMANPAYQHRR